MAKDLGFDGIEVRGLGKEISTFNMQPFSEGEIDRTVRTLADLRLSIPCLSSGIALKFADKRAANIAELTDYIHMGLAPGRALCARHGRLGRRARRRGGR